jgi:aryl sulfotransferase
MSRVIWIASYPKSGNTWTRAFLTSLNGGGCEVDINGLGSIRIASAMLPFEFATGLRVTDLTEEEIETLRPEVHRFLAERAKNDCFLKVHDAYIYTSKGVPMFPADASKGAVYLLRNPLDVAVSWANHSGISIGESVSALNSCRHSLSVRIPGRGGFANQLRQRLLTWGEHVLSWVDAKEIKVLPIRYEDMKREPLEAFTKIVSFSGLEKTTEEIGRAVEQSRFEMLKEQESKQGFREKAASCGSFFNRGESGYWREHLTEDQVASIIEHNSEVMARFNYLDENGNPI